MLNISGWIARAGVLRNDNPKGPWGGGNKGEGGSPGEGGGPRNPWAFPPEGRRGRSTTSTSLDEFLKRARGGGGGGGGGRPGLPLPGGSSIWWIGAGLLVLLWVLFTSIHSIGPEQRGVVTTLGNYSGTLSPGVQLTAPSPFAQVRKVDVEAIRNEEFPQGSTADNLMLTGDQNIIDLAYSVQWNVRSPENFIFQIADPEATVRAVAESAMRSAVASVTLDQALGVGRTVIEAQVLALMQQILDEYRSGIRISNVAIRAANPPAAVDEDFKAVNAAQQQAQANLNQARAYAQQVIARAQGEAAEFDKIYEQYVSAPEVTRRRLYYETMEAVLAKSNKTIVESGDVTPYLPLPNAAARPAATPEPQTPPVVVQGGAN
ncbi:protease modulator HflK [Sphingomonas japonica]|uniref:Membrane protease subunit HflK n=1 Tax=Sphingomonas japonica TaxID=511662 RepID=A0ABX0U1W2_9SPHN|nr:protease modulator HflK [Sphingomonas japonica]NIJ24070.1 membrane protease subunit HflK [Sphingomonas japonica]